MKTQAGGDQNHHLGARWANQHPKLVLQHHHFQRKQQPRGRIRPLWGSSEAPAPATPPEGSPGRWEEAMPGRVGMLRVGKSAWLQPPRGKEKVQHRPAPGMGPARPAPAGSTPRAAGTLLNALSCCLSAWDVCGGHGPELQGNIWGDPSVLWGSRGPVACTSCGGSARGVNEQPLVWLYSQCWASRSGFGG